MDRTRDRVLEKPRTRRKLGVMALKSLERDLEWCTGGPGVKTPSLNAGGPGLTLVRS